MKIMHYTLILALMLSVTACGVRRDLSIPKPDKTTEQQENAAPATTEAAPADTAMPVE